MAGYNEYFDLLLTHFKQIFYPEEWLALDFAFSKSEIFALLIVERHGEITMSQVADYLNIPMSTATGIANRLVKNGYLERERSESDRRIVTLRLAGKGKEVVDRIKGMVVEYVQLIDDALTVEERELLYRIFLRVVDKLGTKRHEEVGKNKASAVKKIEIE